MRFAQTIVDEPKYGREQAGCRDLGGERADPGAEHERAERESPGPLPGCDVGHLQAEDALDLTERSRREHSRDHDDERENEPEADTRPALLTMPASPRRSLGAVVQVRPRDRVGIERGLVLDGWRLRDRRSWTGHERILGTGFRHVKPVPSVGGHMLHAMERPRGRGRMSLPGAGELSGMGGRLTFLFGLLLAVSALTGWYSGDGNGTTVSVIGWHTGTIGKIVLFLGLAAIVLVVVREAGVSMPASVPESLVSIGIGSIATILVLVRIVSIPDSFFFASRGIGIWISLACAVGIILAGLLEASDEL